MVIITRGVSSADKVNVTDPVEQDPTVAASVPEEGTVGDSVPQVSIETVRVPVVEVTLAKMPPVDENSTLSGSAPEDAVEDSLLGYLRLVGSLEKNVSHSDDQSLALSSSNVSNQHRKRAVDVENSFVQGLSAIGESYGFNEIDISTVNIQITHISHFLT